MDTAIDRLDELDAPDRPLCTGAGGRLGSKAMLLLDLSFHNKKT